MKYVTIAKSAKFCEVTTFEKLDPYPILNDPEVLI